MKLYRKISSKIKSGQVKTITVDIFDTVLLRKIWPEDAQFLKVAQLWLDDFREMFSGDITAAELYSYRIYARNEIIETERRYNKPEDDEDFSLKSLEEYDVTLENWFLKIIELFENKYQKDLSTAEEKHLLNKMIKKELNCEKDNLIPNVRLVRQIKQLKEDFREIKVFFVSDMYLTSDNINELLKHFGIDIFDGGISSTEAKHTKAIGKMYDYLHVSKVLDKNFNISKNIHIGDNVIVDIRNSISSGSDAYRVRTFRPLKKPVTIRYRLKMKRVKKKLAKNDKRALIKNTHTNNNATDVWQNYGRLFVQPLLVFLYRLEFAAEAAPNTNFVMVSSEATVFQNYRKKLFLHPEKRKNIIVAEKLNRRRAIRALLWTLYKKKDLKYDIESLFQIVNLGEVNGSRRDFYDFLFGREYPYSEMATNFRSEKDFRKALFEELGSIDKKYLKPLKEAYDYVKQFLPKDKDTKIVIVDAGWGGTVQVLFSEFCNLHGYRSTIDGLYIGVMPFNRYGICEMPPMHGYLMTDVKYGKERSMFCAVIWEYPYTAKPQFSDDYAHLEQIKIGMEEGIKDMQKNRLAPKAYYDKCLKPEIKRLVSKPTMMEAKIIGGISFDCGFAKPLSFNIIDKYYTRGQIYKLLLLHPRRLIKNYIFVPNHWTAGFIKYYRIPFIKTIIKICGRLMHKTLI